MLLAMNKADERARKRARSDLSPLILLYTFKSKNMSMTYAPMFIDPGLVNPVSWRHKFHRYSMFVPRMKGLTK